MEFKFSRNMFEPHGKIDTVALKWFPQRYPAD